MSTKNFRKKTGSELPALDPRKVAQVVREASPVSEFEKAMEKARGFHSYYEGRLDNDVLTRMDEWF